MSSFSTALSGLQANTNALNVVGDNLANMNTQGFKSNGILFEDAMQQSMPYLMEKPHYIFLSPQGLPFRLTTPWNSGVCRGSSLS